MLHGSQGFGAKDPLILGLRAWGSVALGHGSRGWRSGLEAKIYSKVLLPPRLFSAPLFPELPLVYSRQPQNLLSGSIGANPQPWVSNSSILR